jgi:hypothetical protein
VTVTVMAWPFFLLVTLTLEPEGQRFVGRRHDVVVERDTAGSFGSRLRRVSHGVLRCYTVFGTTSASLRISASSVFLPSSRCSSRTWLCKAR